ncbi:MAG: type III secretion system cytoplasmic ring protein SctQ [Pseudomonadota bacterium]
MSGTPLTLAKVSADQVALTNSLSAKFDSIALEVAGKPYALKHIVSPMTFATIVELKGKVDGLEASVSIDRDPFAGIIGLPVTAADLSALPDALKLPVVDATLNEALAPCLEPYGLTVGLEEVREAKGDAVDGDVRPVIQFQLLDNDQRPVLNATLQLEQALAARIQSLAEDVSPDPARMIDVAGLAVPARIELGRTRLALSGLNSIDRDDVILIDEHAWDRQLASLIVEGFRRFAVEINEEDLTVVDDAEDPLVADEELDAQEEPSAGAVEEIILPLTVDLGKVELSVAEIANIAAGTTLELGKAVDGAVDLRVHGRLIGRGQLVDIEGRLGVRVMSIFARQDG